MDVYGGAGGERAGRVLVVDDSTVVRAIVRALLAKAGYEIAEARDGAAALEALDHFAADVVITDLSMPGLDGLGLLEQIRCRPDGPEVVILTGSRADHIESALRALRLGAHDFLTKPFRARRPCCSPSAAPSRRNGCARRTRGSCASCRR